MSTVKNPTPEATTSTAEPTGDGPVVGRTSPTPTTTAATPPRTVGRGVAALVGTALVAVAITVGVVAGLQTTTPDAPVGVSEQAALERLVGLGQIPDEALEPATGQDAVSQRLRDAGLVPTGPTVPRLSDAAREQTLTQRLVARGLVPPETLVPSTERGHTHRLIIHGLVPDGP